MKQNKKITKEHPILTIKIIQYEDGSYIYEAQNIDKLLKPSIILEGTAVILDALIQTYKEKNIPIPKYLNKFNIREKEK